MTNIASRNIFVSEISMSEPFPLNTDTFYIAIVSITTYLIVSCIILNLTLRCLYYTLTSLTSWGDLNFNKYYKHRNAPCFNIHGIASSCQKLCPLFISLTFRSRCFRVRSNTDRLDAGPRDWQRFRHGHGHRRSGGSGCCLGRPRLPRAAA